MKKRERGRGSGDGGRGPLTHPKIPHRTLCPRSGVTKRQREDSQRQHRHPRRRQVAVSRAGQGAGQSRPDKAPIVACRPVAVRPSARRGGVDTARRRGWGGGPHESMNGMVHSLAGSQIARLSLARYIILPTHPWDIGIGSVQAHRHLPSRGTHIAVCSLLRALPTRL